MQQGFYIAGVASAIAEQKMSILNHNLANVNTAGYQSSKLAFGSLLAAKDAANDSNALPAAYPSLGEHFLDVSKGLFQQTGNRLDVAIHGHAYFRLALAGGQEAYSRSGQFQLNAQRQLVNASGLLVLDNSGKPIQLPEGDVRIDEQGSISVQGKPIARLGLVAIKDPSLIEQKGSSLLQTPASNLAKPSSIRLLQGETEGSNVNAVITMTQVMSTLRQYQTTMKIVDQYSKIEQQLSNKVGLVRG